MAKKRRPSLGANRRLGAAFVAAAAVVAAIYFGFTRPNQRALAGYHAAQRDAEAELRDINARIAAVRSGRGLDGHTLWAQAETADRILPDAAAGEAGDGAEQELLLALPERVRAAGLTLTSLDKADSSSVAASARSLAFRVSASGPLAAAQSFLRDLQRSAELVTIREASLQAQAGGAASPAGVPTTAGPGGADPAGAARYQLSVVVEYWFSTAPPLAGLGGDGPPPTPRQPTGGVPPLPTVPATQPADPSAVPPTSG